MHMTFSNWEKLSKFQAWNKIAHNQEGNSSQERPHWLPVIPTCATDRPSVRPAVRGMRLTARPVLLRRKTNIVLSAKTSSLFIATTKDAPKEAAPPSAAPPLLWEGATFVVAVNRADVIALNTISVLCVSKIGLSVGPTLD